MANKHAFLTLTLFAYTYVKSEICECATTIEIEERQHNTTKWERASEMARKWTEQKKKVKLQHYNVIIDRAANKNMYAKNE